MLFIVFLVMAFANPVEKQHILEQKNLNRVLVYVDNSPSMNLPALRGGKLDQARRVAISAVNSMPGHFQYGLLTNETINQPVQFTDKQTFLKALQQLKIVSSSVPMSRVLSAVRLAGQDTQFGSVLFISDFQKSTTDINRVNWTGAPLISLIPVQGLPVTNFYVDSCWFDSDMAAPGSVVSVKVRVRRSGPVTRKEVPLSLTINGEKTSFAAVNAEKETWTGVLHFKPENAGFQRGVLFVDDPSVPFDNRFFFIYESQPETRILHVYEGEPCYCFENLFQSDSDFVFHQKEISRLVYSSLGTYQLIIFDQIRHPLSGLGEVLGKITRAASTDLIWIPALENGPVQHLAEQLAGFPVYFGEWQSDKTEVVSIETSHSLYKGVFEEEVDLNQNKNFDLPVVQQYLTLNSRLEPLLKMANGKSFLSATENEGASRQYYFSSPFDTASTNFIHHGLFVPTLHRMAMLSQPKVPSYFEAGSLVTRRFLLDAGIGDEVIRMIRQDDGAVYIPPMHHRGHQVVLNIQVPMPGFYRFDYSGQKISEAAFNTSRLESATETFTAADLKEFVAELPGMTVNLPRMANDGQVARLDLNPSDSLWKWFVWGALLMLAFEVILLRLKK